MTATILLAEDNPGDVFLVRRALEKHGLKAGLVVMEDGQAAMKYLESIDKSLGTIKHVLVFFFWLTIIGMIVGFLAAISR